MKTIGLGATPLLASRPAVRKPNIVLITVDDLGWTDLACFGSTYYETPNVDRLASQGAKFTNAYAACAVCSPSRAAIMTGRYPARLGITNWIWARFQGGGIPPDGKNPSGYTAGPKDRLLCPENARWLEHGEITVAEALKSAGYTTCHIGKWHLGFENWFPEKQGFDINLGGCDMGQPPGYFDPYGLPTLPPRRSGEYLTDREAEEAVKFIGSHRDQPFFLNLCHYAVHTPLEGKEKLIGRYRTKPAGKQNNAIYAAMIESVDDSVGRVMRALDEANLASNTLVIFTSDNGGLAPRATDNSPLREGKGWPYEGGIRVPQIVRWPSRVKAGTVIHTPVSSIDFFPTLCQAGGAAMPEDRPIDGVSLVPLITGTGSVERDALYWHFPHYRRPVVPYSIIRSGNWKLIRRYEEKPFELFNLKDDLSETTDLSSRNSGLVKQLDAKLTAWLQSTRAKMPKENPGYRGA